MQTNDELLTLAATLEKTLSPNSAERKPAEKFLHECESKPRFFIALLQLLDHATVSPTAKFSAAVCFKNVVKRDWKVGEDEVDKISAEDRDAVKQLIVDAMLRSPDTIQKQLSDALAIIGKEDFPAKWPNLVDNLVAKFRTGDFAVINGVLRTTHSLFKRFRYEMKSNELFTEIKFVLERFATPFTELFQYTLTLCEEHRTDVAAMRTLYSSVLLCSKIYYTLNYQDLPEFFEDHLQIWMSRFLALLTLDLANERNATLRSALASSSNDEAGTMELIRAEICEIACLFAQKYDEEFAPHCPSFVTAVWNLLTTTGSETKYDLLVSNAIQLLAIVAERPAYKQLFEDASALQSICERVVIPNMHLRDSDVEMFEDNPEEFIRRDLEHSDVDTRRRAACDLVRSLCRLFEGPVIDNFARYVSALLEAYGADRNGQWRSKDVALYLVTSLATRGATERFGVTRAATTLVNLTEFARTHVLTELQEPATSVGAAVVKAAALKYVTVFRSQLPAELVQQSFALSIKYLRASQVVLHTYACYAVDRFFVQRARSELETATAGGPGRLVVDKQFAVTRLAASGESVQSLLGSLFAVLELPGSAENEYAMKAIMRSLSALQEASLPYLATVVARLTQVLASVAKNPNKPHFNHCLFEALCVCVRQACRADPSAAAAFESSLFPVFEFILQNDVQDFQPYIFQLLAVLMEQYAVPSGVPDVRKLQLYFSLYPFLFADVLWDSAANQPALTRLLGAYCETLRDALTDEQLEALLTLISKLMTLRSADHFAFSLLQSLLQSLARERTLQFAKRVFVAVFQRLTAAKTPKFVKLTISFFNLFVAVVDAETFVSLVDSLQPRLFAMVAERLVIPETGKIAAKFDRKVCAVGTTKMLSEARLLPPGDHSKYWPQIFTVALSLVEACANDEFGGTNNNVPVPSSTLATGGAGDGSLYDAEHFVEIEDVGCASATRARAPTDYQATFTPLIFAARKERDTVASLGDLRVWFARELARLAQTGPAGRVPTLIQSARLQPAQLETLQRFLQLAGVQLA